MVLLRVAAVGVATSVFLTWFSSRARVDFDEYTGNPLPLIDWLVVGLAIATALFRPQLATVAGAVSLGSVGLTLFLASVDAAEGLAVSLGYGIFIAAVSSAGLVWLGARDRSEQHRRRLTRAAARHEQQTKGMG